MFSSIPSLYPLGASSNTSTSHGNKKCLQTFPKRQKSLQGENHVQQPCTEINTPNFKQLVKTASKIVNKLSCSPSCRDHLWPITLTGLLSYRLGHVASALGNCMRSVGWRHWWHWVTHSLHSLCSSAAGRQLSDLLTDSDDSSNQSYDPNTVECVRYK